MVKQGREAEKEVTDHKHGKCVSSHFNEQTHSVLPT